MGQRPLSVAQVLDRLRSGSTASAAEACAAVRLCGDHINYMARLGRPLKCPPLVMAILDAGLIPLLAGLLAKGGVAATWACSALSCVCVAGGRVQLEAEAAFKCGRANFMAAGGVDSAVELLALPQCHPGLAKLPSLECTARTAVGLLYRMASEEDRGRAFRVRCIDAGIVPPLLQRLSREGYWTPMLDRGAASISASSFIYQLCRNCDSLPDVPPVGPEFERAIRCVCTAFIGGGVAPILVNLMRLPKRCGTCPHMFPI